MSATLHEAQAHVGMSLARGGTGSAFAVDGFEKLALPLWENQVGGFRRAPSLPKDSRGFGHARGHEHAINSRRAKPAFKARRVCQ
jgi:hypothetical protein